MLLPPDDDTHTTSEFTAPLGRLPDAAERQAWMLAELGPNSPLAPVRHLPRRRYNPRRAHQDEQRNRVLAYLTAAHTDATVGPQTIVRAAVMLRAEQWHPEAQRTLGMLAAPVDGEHVKCSRCKRRWLCQPEDPYFNATGRTDGLCALCVFTPGVTPSKTPPAAQVISSVTEPPPRRQPRRRADP